MSYTEIYAFDKEGNAKIIGEIKNSFRGAMAVWMEIEKRHLPKYIPSWALGLKQDEDKIYPRTSDMTGMALYDIWNLFGDPEISRVDRIALGSTLDGVVVMKSDISELVSAFRSFEGATSLPEQADIIEKVINDNDDIIAIAWNQTSINGDAWETDILDETEEYYLPYNILTGTEHWNLFDDLKKKK